MNRTVRLYDWHPESLECVKAALIRKIADELTSAKSAKYGKLTVTTTGKDSPT